MFKRLLVAALALLGAGGALAQPSCTGDWSDPSRQAFYTTGQGSQMMLRRWMEALRQPDGTPFLADSLARYGFIPNPATPGLPIGFTDSVRPSDGARFLGMTCAACHTRVMSLEGRSCIVDGGPALADFQRFAEDLKAAASAALPPHPDFARFADAVLGPGRDEPTTALLAFRLGKWRDDFGYWTDSIPADAPNRWGPGRMDAVAMIFNRITGFDLGLDHPKLVPAAAPVRYPFLWNAPKQSWTQWTRFARNDSQLLANGRNLGEVYGVFGHFAPRPDPVWGVTYLVDNSADFGGLERLEDLVREIPSPEWRRIWPAGTPHAVDEGRARLGSGLYQTHCVACHALPASSDTGHWFTGPPDGVPLTPATDNNALRLIKTARSDTGILAGTGIPFGRKLGASEPDVTILTYAVLNTLLRWEAGAEPHDAAPLPVHPERAREAQEAADAASGDQVQYEARVLYGVWAAAPFLHNGSVPTLADLLERSDRRPPAFAVGAAFDPGRVGLAPVQPPGSFVLETTGCEDTASGRSRCGHEYGTELSPADKLNLLEYLKTL